MPIPEPNDDETQKDFISRCMGDDVMVADYTDREQRAAVCYGQWRKAKGKSMLPLLDKQARYEIDVLDAKLKAKAMGEDGDAGWIEGYASTFNNLDLQREVVRPGCWAKSIQERVPAGRVKLMVRHYAHGGDVLECVGGITEANEDDVGLWFHAELSSVQMAQDVRVKVGEGLIGHSSVGYAPVRWADIIWSDGEPAVELLEARWLETTLTNMPANELAVLTAAKAVLSDSAALSKIDSRDLTDADRGRITSVLEQVNILSKTLNSLLTGPAPAAPDNTQRLAAVHAELEGRRRWLELQAMGL